jgi:dolichyl-phosphate beta-glucosyltransferase
LEIGRKLKTNLKVIKCAQNAGKGNAVKLGMLASGGEYILFADADNATDVSSFAELEKEIERIKANGLGVVVGSRNHNRDDVKKDVKVI